MHVDPRFEAGSGAENEVELLKKEVLPIQEVELTFNVDLFKKRADWIFGMNESTRDCIESMMDFAYRQVEPRLFLVLIGMIAPGEEIDSKMAEIRKKDFLAQARKFLQEVSISISFQDTLGTTVLPRDLRDWVEKLRNGLFASTRALGEEAPFREKQSRYLSLSTAAEAA